MSLKLDLAELTAWVAEELGLSSGEPIADDEFTAAEYLAELHRQGQDITQRQVLYRLERMVQLRKLERRKLTHGGSQINVYRRPRGPV